MRRGLLLLALMVAVIWLVSATPRGVEGKLRSTAFSSRAAAPLAPSPTDCGGCDPNDESYCINTGGMWDPNSCTCTYGCDPNQEQQCYFDGGSWDPNSCVCTYPECNPGPPQEVGQEHEDYSYCDGWEIWDCEGTWHDYEVYCQDGSLYDSWSEYTEVCSSDGTPCGDQCDWDPYSCCDDWYCY